MAIKNGSQITLKLDPQPNDFLVGLNNNNPNQFIRIPLGTIPIGNDFSSFSTASNVAATDFLFGSLQSAPGIPLKIPISLIPTGTDFSSISTASAIGSTDFLFGSLQSAPGIPLKIPLSLLPSGSVDFSSLNTVTSVVNSLVFIGLYPSDPNVIFKIPFSLIQNKRKARTYSSPSATITLTESSEYFQFIQPTSSNPTIVVKLPTFSLPAFEVEIINASTNTARSIQIKTSSDSLIYTLQGTAGIYKGINIVYANGTYYKKLVEYFV
jgi:hypothetical protein